MFYVGNGRILFIRLMRRGIYVWWVIGVLAVVFLIVYFVSRSAMQDIDDDY